MRIPLPPMLKFLIRRLVAALITLLVITAPVQYPRWASRRA